MMATKLPILILAAAGGRRLLVDLPDPPLAPDGRPLLQGQQDDDDSGGGLTSGMVLLFLVAVAMVITFLFCPICNKQAEQETSGRGQRPPTSNGGGGHQGRRPAPRQRQVPAAAVVDDDDIESGNNSAAPRPLLLECTYRAAEGWEETTCSVCLAELADGESLRVVIPCRHYFHTACIVEWLRKSATCPLCRAPLPKDARRRRT